MSPKPERVGEGIYNLEDEKSAQEAINTGLDIITSAARRNHPDQNPEITGLFIDCHEGTWCIHPAVRYKLKNLDVWVALGGVGFSREFLICVPSDDPDTTRLIVAWGGEERDGITYEKDYNEFRLRRFMDQNQTPQYLPLSPAELEANFLAKRLMGDTVLSSARRDLSMEFLHAINNAGGLSSETPAESSGDKTFSDMSPQERRDCEREITQSDAI